jgi:hypothetical protein
VNKVTIINDDGTQFSAELDSLPRVGDHLLISTGVGSGTNEVSYLIKEVNIHLTGPMILNVSSITILVSKA